MQAWLASVQGRGGGGAKLGPLTSELHADQWSGPHLGHFIAGTNATVR